MRLLTLLLAWGLLITAGCQSSRSGMRLTDTEFRQLVKEYNQDAPEHEQVICEKVAPIGSNYKKWQCRKKNSRTLETIKSQDMLLRMQQRGSQAIQSGG